MMINYFVDMNKRFGRYAMKKKNLDKRWIINTVLFLLTFIIIFCYLSYLFRPVSQNRKNIVGFYSEPNDTLDVVCIGGSSTYVYWMPYMAWNEHKITSYNLSTDAMSPSLIKNLVIEAKKTQNPQLYVIDLRAFDVREIDPVHYSEPFIRVVTDSMKYSLNRLDTIRYAYGFEKRDFTGMISNIFDISYYHSEWQNLKKENYKYVNNDVTEDNKGFMFVTFSWHKMLEKKDWSHIETEKELGESTNQIFIDVLEYCKENELNVLFTVNPFYQETSDTKERYNYMKRIIAEYGYDFINTNDYYDEMGIDFSTDFYNENHTNLLGAEKYTRFLSQYIMENYNIDTEHEQSVESSWNNGFIGWTERVNNHKQILINNIK